MKKSFFILLLFALSVTFLLQGSGVAFAEETTCVGYMGAVTVDNLRVPDGESCTLYRTRVIGTIYVETDSTLSATRVRVNGNIQAEGAASVTVKRSIVGGSIQLVQGGTAWIDRVSLIGDILLDDNEGALTARYNTVGGDVQAFQNTGGVEILNNTIDGNLQCLSNEPAPTGGGNIVHGEKQDQCADL